MVKPLLWECIKKWECINFMLVDWYQQMPISKSLPVLNLNLLILKTLWSVYLRWNINLILGGTECFAGTYVMSLQVGIGSLVGTVFPGETLYPSGNYVIFIVAYWYRRRNSGPQNREIYISLHWNFLFQGVSSIENWRKTYSQIRKYV